MRPDACSLLSLLMGLSLAACGSQIPHKDQVENANADGVLERQPIVITAQPLSLNPSDPGDTKVGQLTYLKGWSLTADNEKFGGFSGMVFDGNQMIAISDHGEWLIADFDPQQDTAPFSNAIMMPFFPGLSGTKEDYDAEGLTTVPDGLLVSFEANHRVHHVAAPGADPDTPKPLNFDDIKTLPSNNGLEAIVHHPLGPTFLFAERGAFKDGRRRAWMVTEDGPTPRGYEAPRGHSPTAATMLPDGGILMVNRAFSPLFGVSIALVHIDSKIALGDGPLKGTLLGTLKSSLNIDNMEAVAVVGQQDGMPVIALMSDDNFNPLQRTLLLLFKLDLSSDEKP